jgi:uncharacterized protein
MKKINRAVITGASSGIGEAFAYKLASQGVNLVIAARRTEQLNALAKKLTEKFHVSVEVCTLDLNDTEAAEKLLQFATHDGHQVDLLINNAGAGPYRNFLNTSLVEHQKIIQLNLVSLTALCHKFAHHMVEHKKPSYILNVASVASYQAIPKFAVYCATKSYVRIFSEIFSYEMKDSNVSVSCLCPGGTKTEFLDVNNQKTKSGDTFLMSAEKVAHIGLEGTLAKRPVIIPGIFNKLSSWAPRFFPSRWNIFMSAKAMELAVNEKN